MIYRKFIKGLLDRLVAGILIIVLFPWILGIFLVLFVTQGRQVFFVQSRTGKDLKHFKMYKFRTLLPHQSNDLGMENRKFTFFGKTMRQSGLDELPQLFNVLFGEMSFVGPRPLPINYEDKYQKSHLSRFDVKPGITGWAQVNGRNDISWGKRFELDVWYVNHLSFSLDAKIIWLTTVGLFCTFKNSKPHGNMEVFDGSNLT